MTNKVVGVVSAVMAQIRAEAAAAGISISALAREVDVSRSSLDLYLNGRRQMPIDVLYRIAAVIGIDTVVILARAEQRLDI
jgi:transcriptional regulator with XRE-family HTH domain